MLVKKCSQCKKTQVLNQYSKNISTKDGLQAECRSCKNKSQQKWRAKNKKNKPPKKQGCKENRNYATAENIIKDNIKADSKTGCWEWQRSRNVAGYGVTMYNGKKWMAHRLSAHLLMDVNKKTHFMDGDICCHKCDNPGCCNPEHLFIGSHSDNMRDMHNKRRNADSLWIDSIRKGIHRKELDELLSYDLCESLSKETQDKMLQEIREKHRLENIKYKKN